MKIKHIQSLKCPRTQVHGQVVTYLYCFLCSSAARADCVTNSPLISRNLVDEKNYPHKDLMNCETSEIVFCVV